jgi:uncharacterized protein (DUF983 family)
MSGNTEVTYHGIGFPGLLAILFIGLKLTGQIDWEWIWVLSPLWIPLAIFLGFMAIALVAGVIISLFAGAIMWHERKNK